MDKSVQIWQLPDFNIANASNTSAVDMPLNDAENNTEETPDIKQEKLTSAEFAPSNIKDIAPRVYSEEEVEQIKQDVYQQACMDITAQNQKLYELCLPQLQILQQALQTQQEHMQQHAVKVEAEFSGLFHKIWEKTKPSDLALLKTKLFEFLEQHREHLYHIPHLTIHVPADQPELLSILQQSFEGHKSITMQENNSQNISIDFNWSDGGASISVADFTPL